MNNYRKIYTDYYKVKIPKDLESRSYEIHHIDGNHSNNDPLNLKAVTLQEHYDIHYSQGDFTACFVMAGRLKISYQSLCELAKKAANERVINNTHNFQGDRNPSHKRIENNTHNFQNKEWAKRRAKQENAKRITNKTHNFLGGELSIKLLIEGKHQSQKEYQCPHCNIIGKGNTMKRWHFNNCKEKYIEATG